jgi:hypothetical protein
MDHVTRGARVSEWATNESMLSELAPVNDDDLVFDSRHAVLLSIIAAEV